MSLRGQLLIASPSLFDPNFRRSVVLVAHHDEDGAVGLVLNRRSDTRAAQAVPPVADLVDSDATIWLGGPVEPESVLLVAEVEDPDEAFVLVFDCIGFVSVDEGGRPATRRLRVFAGFAGWGPAQLEGELEVGSWLQEPAQADDVFSDGDLFGEVLRRKGGSFRILAQMPLDPSLN